MDQDRDLLPWILGALSMASVAIAMTVASTSRTQPSTVSAPAKSATAYVLPAAAVPTPPAPARTLLLPAQMPPTPAQLPTRMAAQLPTQAPPMAQANQIWECAGNGQRIFSSSPCGANAVLREVGPINTMRATPYSYADAYSQDSPSEPAYDYPGAQESADSAYPILVAFPYNARHRPEHPHRLPARNGGRSPRI